MNNEIKKILDNMEATFETTENNSYIKFKWIDYKYFLNYITNLQEENKKLLKKSYSDDVKISKAIEYFKYQLEQLDFYEDMKAKMLCAMGIVILKGENNDLHI